MRRRHEVLLGVTAQFPPSLSGRRCGGRDPTVRGPLAKGSARCEVHLRRAHSPTRTAVPTESDRAMKSEEPSQVLSVNGRQVRITHPDKPYFSRDIKLTKLDLVRYYLSV